MRFRIPLLTLILFQLAVVCYNYKGQYFRLIHPFSNYDVDYFSFQNESKSEITLFSLPLSKSEAKKFFSSGAIHNSFTNINPNELGAVINGFTILTDENNIKRQCEYDVDGKLVCKEINIQSENFNDGINYLKIKIFTAMALLILLLLNAIYLLKLIIKKELFLKKIYIILLLTSAAFILIYSGFYTSLELCYLLNVTALF